MKALEDLSVAYDGSVRNASGGVVQLRYGDDGMDPAHMEAGDGLPLSLDKVFATCQVLLASAGRRDGKRKGRQAGWRAGECLVRGLALPAVDIVKLEETSPLYGILPASEQQGTDLHMP